MLEIDQTPQNDIVERLIQSRSFKNNPLTWSVFYATRHRQRGHVLHPVHPVVLDGETRPGGV